MKRFAAFMMALIMCFSLCACGGGTDSAVKSEESAGAEENQPAAEPEQNDGENGGEGIVVDEKLFSVEITLPASFFEDESEEDIMANAEEQGYNSCTINEDGSVTYKMSKEKHQEALAEFRESAEGSFAELLEGENAVASFDEIRCNDNYSEINVVVNDNYSLWDMLYVYQFYLIGAYYQILEGADADTVDVIVNFIDAEGNVLDSASYREFMANSEESKEGDDGMGDEEDEENSAQTTGKAAAYTEILPGETVISEDECEFYVDFFQITDRVDPPQTGSWYSYYEADKGKVYVDVCVAYKNLDEREVNADEVISGTLVYGGKYEYEGFSIIEEANRGDFTYTNITSIAPLTTGYVHYLFAVPEEVESSDGALWAILNIDGEEYKLGIREGVEGEVASPGNGAVAKDKGSVADGEIIAITGKCEFFVDFSQITDRVDPPSPGDWYSYYEAEDGMVYVDLCIGYRNLKKSEVMADDVMSAELTYAEKYEYEGFSIIEEKSRGDLTYSNITSIAPLCTEYIHYLFSVPETVAEGSEPITIEFTIGGNTYNYTVR